MTRRLPFTEASIARLIRGIERAGRHVLGVRPDGIVIVGQRPLENASMIPVDAQNHSASKWEDKGI